MSTRDEAWPSGTPCWIDLVVSDPAKAASFYRDLFGWTCEETTPDAGGYRICTLDGSAVAGIGPRPRDVDMPDVWTTYLASDDADETARRITDSGGSVKIEPFDVLDHGRMGFAFDPGGAAFGIWQAKGHLGSTIVNEPGALTWSECMTRDYEGSLDFYARVFDLEYDEIGDGETFRYSAMKVAGSLVGGLGALDPETPREIPAHWMTYLGAEDTDALVARATGLGAIVRLPPTDSEYGRMAVLEGLQGEVFSVIAVSSSTDGATDDSGVT